MDALFNLLNRAVSLQNDFAVHAIDTEQNRELMVKLNTESQLYDKGVDSEGVPLDEIGGSYSPVTKKIKASEGQRYDHVTLKDTGDFYSSEKAEFLYDGSVLFTADTIKDGRDLQDRYGRNILGLTDESKDILKPIFANDVITHLKDYLVK